MVDNSFYFLIGMSNNKNIDINVKETDILFNRYFNGDISYDDYIRLKAGQKEMSEEEITDVMSNLWNKYDSRDENVPTELFDAITNEITKKPERTINYWMAIAASLLLVCLGGATFWYLSQESTVYRTYATNTTETLNITLPDGTTARLNTNTEVQCFESNDAPAREIKLIRGEILLNVTKDAGRTFTVQTGNMRVEVLGTVFNVQNLEGSDNIETTLLEGSVKLTCNETEEEVYLKAGQKALFNSRQQTFSVKRSFANEDNVWRNNELVFKSAPLTEVFSIIESYYGVDIVTNKPVQTTESYTFSFEEITLSDLMEILSIHFNFKYKMNDETIHVTFSPE